MAEVAELRELVTSLHGKIDALLSQQSTPRTRQSGKVEVPLDCQKAVRSIVKELSKAENPIQINYDQIKDNQEAMERAVEETRRVFRDRWSRGIIAQAFTNVITNDKQEKRRRENGKTDLHRQQSKQSKRKRSKLERRKKALEHLDESWTPTSKKNLTECLRLDITSPEKTDDEDSTKRVRLPFSWESTRLCKAKEALDKAYRHKVLKTESARRQLAFVRDGREDTTTPPPEKCPAWAISREFSS